MKYGKKNVIGTNARDAKEILQKMIDACVQFCDSSYESFGEHAARILKDANLIDYGKETKDYARYEAVRLVENPSDSSCLVFGIYDHKENCFFSSGPQQTTYHNIKEAKKVAEKLNEMYLLEMEETVYEHE